MSFWPIVVLAAVAIMLAVLNVSFPLALRTDGASEQFIYLAFLLVISAWTILIKVAKDNPVEQIEIEKSTQP